MIRIQDQLEKKYMKTIKTGRTHLQDAVPLTFGQEVSGWKSMMEHSLENVKRTLPSLKGDCAGRYGSGHRLECAEGICRAGRGEPEPFDGERISSPHRINSMPSLRKDAYVAHGALEGIGGRFDEDGQRHSLAGQRPECGMGEITIPASRPGSSIMPGKVNPTQTESATMVAVRVMGNDTVVGVVASQGNFELNVYMPVMAEAFLESVNLLAESLTSLKELRSGHRGE